MSEPTENYLYFAHEWLFDRERTERVSDIFTDFFDTLQRFDLKVAVEMTCSLEGYHGMTFTIQVSSKKVLDTFIDNIRVGTRFEAWTQTSLEKIDIHEFVNAKDADIYVNPVKSWPHNLFAAWNDGIFQKTFQNEQLAEKLKTCSPVYFAHDWFVSNKISNDWLQVFKEAWWLTGQFGSELRFADQKLNLNEQYAVRLAIRLYSETELQEFAEEVEKQLGLHGWKQISQQSFAEYIPIGRNTAKSAAMEKKL